MSLYYAIISPGRGGEDQQRSRRRTSVLQSAVLRSPKRCFTPWPQARLGALLFDVRLLVLLAHRGPHLVGKLLLGLGLLLLRISGALGRDVCLLLFFGHLGPDVIGELGRRHFRDFLCTLAAPM